MTAELRAGGRARKGSLDTSRGREEREAGWLVEKAQLCPSIVACVSDLPNIPSAGQILPELKSARLLSPLNSA